MGWTLPLPLRLQANAKMEPNAIHQESQDLSRCRLQQSRLDIAKQVFFSGGNGSTGPPGVAQALTARAGGGILYRPAGRTCRVGMEACGGAQYWARQLQAQGHAVKVMAPRHVKAFRRGQKNDYNDAGALCEAARQPAVRGVPLKSCGPTRLADLAPGTRRVGPPAHGDGQPSAGAVGGTGDRAGGGDRAHFASWCRRSWSNPQPRSRGCCARWWRRRMPGCRRSMPGLGSSSSWRRSAKPTCGGSAAARRAGVWAAGDDGAGGSRGRWADLWVGAGVGGVAGAGAAAATPRAARPRLYGITKRGDTRLRAAAHPRGAGRGAPRRAQSRPVEPLDSGGASPPGHQCRHRRLGQ